jgi:tetratricopeptide (TPR) repeat protein
MYKINMPGKKVKITDKKPVACWEEKITLPVQGPTQHNPLPHFKSIYYGDDLANYPYPMMHMPFIRHWEPVNRDWNMIFLENKYIRLMISPELGGRIYAMVDKSTGKECFHYNPVVKYMHGGYGGLYSSGGKEVDYPQAHAVTNCRDREYKIIKNTDGSVTVFTCEIELLNRTHWHFSYTLEPDASYVREDFRAHNRHFTPAPFLFWNNAGVMSEKSSRFVYSEKTGLQHGGSTKFTYPIYRGIDLSSFEDLPAVLGIYMYNSAEGLVGHYNINSKHGVVRWGDPSGPTGKKYWVWGMDTPEGQLKKVVISGCNEQYSEIQSGYIENQDHYEVMNPMDTVSFTEYWFPVKEIGEPVLSSKYGALAVTHKKDKNKNSASVGFLAAKRINKGNIEISLNDKILKSDKFTLDANEYFIYDIPVSSKANVEKLHVIIKCNGIEVVNYRKNEEKTPALLTQYEQRGGMYSALEAKNNPDVLVQMGKWEDKNGFITKAEKIYREALGIDEKHAEANLMLGILLYKRGLYKDAQNCFDRSATRDPYNGKTYYYMALNAISNKDIVFAKRAARQAVRSREPELGNLILGIIAMRGSDFEQAFEHFTIAQTFNTQSSRTSGYLAVSARKCNRKTDAQEELQKALKISPTDHLLQWEKSESGKKEVIRQFGHLWQLYIELACDYIGLGCFEEALKVLEIAIEEIPEERQKAMLYYYMGFVCDALGQKNSAKNAFRKASSSTIDFVFPFREECFDVLQCAVDYNKEDSNALTFLGMLLFKRERFTAGLPYFRKSAKLNPENWQNYWNIGSYYWMIEPDFKKGYVQFKKMLGCCIDNYYIYQEFSAFMNRFKEYGKLVAFMDSKWELVRYHRRLAHHYVEALLALKKYKKAFDVTMSLKLNPSNEGFGPTGLRAFIEYGDYLVGKKQYDKAISVYSEALIEHDNFQQGPFNQRWYAEARYKIGMAHKKDGRVKDAEKYFRDAISEDSLITWVSGHENSIWINRYFQALAMLELGMIAEGHIALDGFIEFYRMIIAGGNSAPARIKELAWIAKEKYGRCVDTSRGGYDAEI